MFHKNNMVCRSKMVIFTLLLLINLAAMRTTIASEANEPAASPYAGQDLMGEYTFTEYKGFWNNWHLVVARYREDNHELRVTYANDVAWQVIESGGSDFPVGSAFGKVAYGTEPDPLFESSRVPSGSHRYQIMVKDQSRHASPDGWAYAIWDRNGKTFPESPQTTEAACMSCHAIAKDRGFVFLGRMEPGLASLSKNSFYPSKNEAQPFTNVNLAEYLNNKSLPATARLWVDKAGQHLTENVFAGTFSEVQPILLKETKTTGIPSVFIASNRQQWLLISPIANNSSCFIVDAHATDTINGVNRMHSICVGPASPTNLPTPK